MYMYKIYKRYVIESTVNCRMCSYVIIKDVTSLNFTTNYDSFCNNKCDYFYHLLLKKKFCSPCYKSYLSLVGWRLV